MDQATKTMIENLKKNTGKSLEKWITIVKKKNFTKHGEYVKFLKTEHGFTHGFANLVAHKARASDAGSVDDKNTLIDAQYKGKEHFRLIYDHLIQEICKFGKDIEVAPKKAYVSLRRKKQFAMLIPATKTRYEIGLSLKGVDGDNMLLAEKPGSMCSHKIKFATVEDINTDMLNWIKKSYENAG